MKARSLFLVLVISVLNSSSQTGTIEGMLRNGVTHNLSSFVNIGLYQGETMLLGTTSDTTGHFLIEDINSGVYELRFSFVGYHTHTLRNIRVFNDSIAFVEANYPCPHGNQKPKKICPFWHRDNIVPITYGLPTKRTMRRAEEGKCYLGGCIITECDPCWYCKIHKISF